MGRFHLVPLVARVALAGLCHLVPPVLPEGREGLGALESPAHLAGRVALGFPGGQYRLLHLAAGLGSTTRHRW